jgi:hypothetical protein
VTTATASAKPPVAAAGDETLRRLWRPTSTFLVYLLTGGLYGVWWFVVSRREMAEELDDDSGPSAGIALLEGIGQLIPVVNAFVWYRTLTDINKLRVKVNAPVVAVWGWVIALAASIPCIYLLPEVLKPALDAFNPDTREIVKAVGYATFPAQFLVFGYAMGYWNEYWMEKTRDRAIWRPRGPVDWVFVALAVLALVALIAAAVGAI